MADLSLYIHFPFCIKRCRYCDFVSSVPGAGNDMDEYLSLLAREIKLAAITPGLRGRTLATVFIGGGTPSLMAPEQLSGLLDSVRRNFEMSPGAEISIESNPASAKNPAEWLSGARAAGVSRAVVGVQSLDDGELAFLGRAHNSEQAESFFRAVRGAGFSSAGLDLIYGLPESGMESWSRTLAGAIALDPDHISIYCLEMPPGTPMGRDLAAGNISEAPQELQEEMYFEAIRILEETGYERYEISNFARPGHRSRHNIVYWTGGDYLGVGLGASSCIAGARRRNEPGKKKYRAKLDAGFPPLAEGEYLCATRRLREAAVMRLRTQDGFGTKDFAGEFPEYEIMRLASAADSLVTEGLLKKTGNRYIIPHKKLFVSDSIFSLLV